MVLLFAWTMRRLGRHGLITYKMRRELLCTAMRFCSGGSRIWGPGVLQMSPPQDGRTTALLRPQRFFWGVGGGERSGDGSSFLPLRKDFVLHRGGLCLLCCAQCVLRGGCACTAPCTVSVLAGFQRYDTVAVDGAMPRGTSEPKWQTLHDELFLVPSVPTPEH